MTDYVFNSQPAFIPNYIFTGMKNEEQYKDDNGIIEY
jgi:hypothetical protein